MGILTVVPYFDVQYVNPRLLIYGHSLASCIFCCFYALNCCVSTELMRPNKTKADHNRRLRVALNAPFPPLCARRGLWAWRTRRSTQQQPRGWRASHRTVSTTYASMRRSVLVLPRTLTYVQYWTNSRWPSSFSPCT